MVFVNTSSRFHPPSTLNLLKVEMLLRKFTPSSSVRLWNADLTTAVRNIVPYQKKTLSKLRQCFDIIIKPKVKSFEVVILSKDDYINEAE